MRIFYGKLHSDYIWKLWLVGFFAVEFRINIDELGQDFKVFGSENAEFLEHFARFLHVARFYLKVWVLLDVNLQLFGVRVRFGKIVDGIRQQVRYFGLVIVFLQYGDNGAYLLNPTVNLVIFILVRLRKLKLLLFRVWTFWIRPRF